MGDLLDDHLLKDKPSYQFSMNFAITWCIPYLIGAFFRLMHWPGSGLLLIVGCAGLMAYSISAFITLKGRSLGNNFSLVIAFVLIGYYTYQVVVSPFSSSYTFLLFYGILTIVLIVVLEIIKRKKFREKSEDIKL